MVTPLDFLSFLLFHKPLLLNKKRPNDMGRLTTAYFILNVLKNQINIYQRSQAIYGSLVETYGPYSHDYTTSSFSITMLL